MGYTVTNFGHIGRLTALVVGMLFHFGSANAQIHGNNSTIVFVQTPGVNASQGFQYVPVVAVSNEDGSAEGTNDIWPKLVSFQPQTIYVDPFIQSDLSHGVQYNYDFTFEVNARNSQGTGIRIPEGWYQVQLAVIRLSNDRTFNAPIQTPYSRYVTSTSVIVKVNPGLSPHKISLRFPNVTDVAVKHHLFIEFIPLDNKCGVQKPPGTTTVDCIRTNSEGEADPTRSTLKPLANYQPYLIEMPFVPSITSGNKQSGANDVKKADLPYTDKSLTDYISKSQLFQASEKLKRKPKVLSPQQYAAQNKLHFMSPDSPLWDEAGYRWKEKGGKAWKDMFRTILRQKTSSTIHIPDGYTSMFSMLCEALVTKNVKYQKDILVPTMFYSQYGDVFQAIEFCKMFPERTFRISRVTHVGRPQGGEYKKIKQQNLAYSIMSNFALNRSNSQDTTSYFSFSPASIFFNFMSTVGLNMGFVNMGVTNSVGNSRSTSGTGIASMGQTLDFSYYMLNIPTANSTQCLEIRVVPQPGGPFHDPTPGAKNGFYICDAPVAELDIQETWAHVFVRCGNSAIMDCYDPLTQDMNFAVRGDREISAFLYTVRKMLSPEGDNKLATFADTPGSEQFFRGSSLAGHMRYVNTVEFPREQVPSFAARLLYMYSEKFD